MDYLKTCPKDSALSALHLRDDFIIGRYPMVGITAFQALYYLCI